MVKNQEIPEQDFNKIIQILHGNGLERLRLNLLHKMFPHIFNELPGSIEEAFARTANLNRREPDAEDKATAKSVVKEAKRITVEDVKNFPLPITPKPFPINKPAKALPPMPNNVRFDDLTPKPEVLKRSVRKEGETWNIDGKQYVTTTTAANMAGMSLAVFYNYARECESISSPPETGLHGKSKLLLLADVDAICQARRKK
jgi:hypothetical protein